MTHTKGPWTPGLEPSLHYGPLRDIQQINQDLLAALEPFVHLADVMDESVVLNFRGVYVTADQARAAAEAVARAKGNLTERKE